MSLYSADFKPLLIPSVPVSLVVLAAASPPKLEADRQRRSKTEDIPYHNDHDYPRPHGC